MSNNSNSLINREFILITFLGFIFFFIFHSFLLLPIRLVEVGADEKTIGFIMGIAGISTLFLTPQVGLLADKYGRKIFISFGMLILLLSTIPFIFLYEINIFYYLIRIFHGISFSFFFIAAGALTTDVSPENRKTQAIGIYGVFTIINYAFAPYVGTYLINNYSFDYFIIVLTSVALIGFFVSLFLGKNSFQRKVKMDIDDYSYMSCLKRKGVIISSITLFLCGSAFVTTFNFISIYCLSLNISNFHLYFIAYTLSVLFIRIFLGWIPDKYGKWVVTLPSLFILAFSVFLLSIVPNIELLIFAGALFGVGHGFSYISIYSIIIESNPKEARAKSFAISSLSFTSGGMFGCFIFGVIATYLGFEFMFTVIAITVFVTFLLFGFYGKHLRGTVYTL